MLRALAAADGGCLLGVSLQRKDADGPAAMAFAGIEVFENEWISDALGMSQTDIPDGSNSASPCADPGIDHKFGRVGVSLTDAYFGDSNLLDSRELRGRLYISVERCSVGLEVKKRD